MLFFPIEREKDDRDLDDAFFATLGYAVGAEAAAVVPMVTGLEEAEVRSAAGSVACAALSFLGARVSAPRDMSKDAAEALRAACAEEAAGVFDVFGYV